MMQVIAFRAGCGTWGLSSVSFVDLTMAASSTRPLREFLAPASEARRFRVKGLTFWF